MKFIQEDHSSNYISNNPLQRLKEEILKLDYVTSVYTQMYNYRMDDTSSWKDMKELIISVDHNLDDQDFNLDEWYYAKRNLKRSLYRMFEKYGLEDRDPPEYNESNFYYVLGKR